MRLAAASAAVLLAGCQNSATDQALIEKAQETAFLPDCASMRVSFARQVHVPDQPGNVVVIYRASRQCMDQWSEGLNASDWVPGRHGGRSSPDDKIFASPHRADLANEGMVMWFQDAFEPGVKDITQDMMR